MQTAFRHHTLRGPAEVNSSLPPAVVKLTSTKSVSRQRMTCQALPGIESVPSLSPEQVQTATYWGLGLAGAWSRAYVLMTFVTPVITY